MCLKSNNLMFSLKKTTGENWEQICPNPTPLVQQLLVVVARCLPICLFPRSCYNSENLKTFNEFSKLWGRMRQKWDINRIARSNPIFDKSNPTFENRKLKSDATFTGTQVTRRLLVERLYRCRILSRCISLHINIMDLGILTVQQLILLSYC